MTWAALHTFVVNEVVTAATLNTQFGNFNETAPGKAAAAGDTFYGTALNAIAKLAAGTPYMLWRMNAAGTAPEWAGIGLRQTPIYAHASGVSLSTSLADVVSQGITTLGGAVLAIGIVDVSEIKSGANSINHNAELDLDGASVQAKTVNAYAGINGTFTETLVFLYMSTPSAAAHTYKLRADYVAGSTTSASANGLLLLAEFS